jgi:hypothetical protein
MSAREISEIFKDESQKAGGMLRGCSELLGRLYGRSVLPYQREVLPLDGVQASVAIRATDSRAVVYPSILRHVCSNGSIMELPMGIQYQFGLCDMARDDIAWKLRKAIQECSKEEVFRVNVTALRRAAGLEVGRLSGIKIGSMALHFRLAAQAADVIAARFNADSDGSRYGLMNAITSVARDTEDPELRWNLEKLGGDVALARVPIPAPDSQLVSAR